MQRTGQANRYVSINAICNRSGNKAHGNRNIGHDDSQDIHSDSHTPYEVLLNKFLWPMC